MSAQPSTASNSPWRTLALSFHTVEFRVKTGHLPPEFEPHDVDQLLCSHPLSAAEAGVMRFLLHVWNYEHYPFQLRETARWDGKNQAAFTAWVTGKTTGHPMHYF